MTKMHADQRSDKIAGFTLVEMMVVLAIMALVAAIAAPGLVKRYRTDNLDTSASEIVARFRTARTLAIATARPQRIVVDASTRTIRFDERHLMKLADDVAMVVTTGRETAIADKQAVLTFLPNGSASGMEIDLRRGDETERIEVNWLTGLSTRKATP